MKARYLKALLVSAALASTVQVASANPFLAAPVAQGVSPEMVQRLELLEQRALEAQRKLDELTLDQLPGLPAGLIESQKVHSSMGDYEVVGRVNGECLIKRLQSEGFSRIEKAKDGFLCNIGSRFVSSESPQGR